VSVIAHPPRHFAAEYPGAASDIEYTLTRADTGRFRDPRSPLFEQGGDEQILVCAGRIDLLPESGIVHVAPPVVRRTVCNPVRSLLGFLIDKMGARDFDHDQHGTWRKLLQQRKGTIVCPFRYRVEIVAFLEV